MHFYVWHMLLYHWRQGGGCNASEPWDSSTSSLWPLRIWNSVQALVVCQQLTVARAFTCQRWFAKESCCMVKKSVVLWLQHQLCIPLVWPTTLGLSMKNIFQVYSRECHRLPWIFQSNLHPYLSKPTPTFPGTGQGFTKTHGYPNLHGVMPSETTNKGQCKCQWTLLSSLAKIRKSFILGTGLVWVDHQFCGTWGGFMGVFMGG